MDWKSWAARNAPRTTRPVLRPSAVVPNVVPAAPASSVLPPEPRPQVMVPTMLGLAPMPVRRQGLGHSQLGLLDRDEPETPASNNLLVRVDVNHPDRWADLLDRLPNIATEPRPDVDANKMAGVPEGGVMQSWRPTSRYYTGVTDATAQGRFEQHLRRRDAEIKRAQ
jgi:hypothetical protein